MSYAAEEAQFYADAQENTTDSPKLPTGYSENFTYGVGQTVDQSLSISEGIVREFTGLTFSERNDQLKELRKNGTMNDEEFASFTNNERGIPETDYSGMAEYANIKYGTTIRTDKEIRKELQEGIGSRQVQSQNVFDRQTFMGGAGEILGRLTGFALEPAGIVAIPLEGLMLGRYAYTLSQATTRIGRGLKVASISASANMATETAIQPIIFNWHEQIGVDMTWKDALLNIGSVGVLTGTITGAVSGIRTKKGFRGEQLGSAMEQELKDLSAKDVAFIFKNLRESVAVEDAEGKAILKQTEDELNSVSDTTALDHFEKMDAAERAVNDPPYYPPRHPVDGTIQYAEFREIDEASLETEFLALEKQGLFDDIKYKDMTDQAIKKEDEGKKALDGLRENKEKLEILETCLGGKS